MRNRFLIICFLFLLIPLVNAGVSVGSQLGEIQGVQIVEPELPIFNNITASVNRSLFWCTTNQGCLSSTTQIDHNLLNNLANSVWNHTFDVALDIEGQDLINVNNLFVSRNSSLDGLITVFPSNLAWTSQNIISYTPGTSGAIDFGNSISNFMRVSADYEASGANVLYSVITVGDVFNITANQIGFRLANLFLDLHVSRSDIIGVIPLDALSFVSQPTTRCDAIGNCGSVPFIVAGTSNPTVRVGTDSSMTITDLVGWSSDANLDFTAGSSLLTITNYMGFQALDTNNEAGTVITNWKAFQIDDINTVGGITNGPYGIFSEMDGGFFLYQDGDADSFLGGVGCVKIGGGDTCLATQLHLEQVVGRFLTEGNNPGSGANIYSWEFINSDVTTNYIASSIAARNEGSTDDGILIFATSNNAVLTNMAVFHDTGNASFIFDVDIGGDVHLNSLTGSYTGGAATVCAFDNGTLFTVDGGSC